jgi:hypothetical protein
MLVEESRILQVSNFRTLQNSLSSVDFSQVLLDVMVIADEVDSHLKQAMISFVGLGPGPACRRQPRTEFSFNVNGCGATWRRKESFLAHLLFRPGACNLRFGLRIRQQLVNCGSRYT